MLDAANRTTATKPSQLSMFYFLYLHSLCFLFFDSQIDPGLFCVYNIISFFSPAFNFGSLYRNPTCRYLRSHEWI
uniref:Uncharacterized protein n=1 Tax=Arundo donax TaxID=35708 RepID=A0A0A8XTI0_ARUDO